MFVPGVEAYNIHQVGADIYDEIESRKLEQ